MLRRSSFALLGLLAACALHRPAPLSPQLSARARLLRIEDTRRDEPAFLDSMLTSTSAAIRSDAALTVGRIGGRRHLARLRVLAADGDSSVSANALFSLGLLKDSASVEVAVAALHAGPAQGVEAAWLLGQLGERARPALVTALSDRSLPTGERGAIILAAARLRPVPALALAPLLSDPDSAIAWRAAYAVVRGRGTSAGRLLLVQAASPWSSVREQVARGATRTFAGDSLSSMARSALMTLVRDTSARVRTNAVRALSTYGSSTRATIRDALHDSDAAVRLTAAQVLPAVLDSSRTNWLAAFDGEKNTTIQRAIADGAIRFGINIAERANWAASSDWHLRVAAAELDGAGAATLASRRIEKWVTDPDGRVRAAAVGVEARLADSVSVRDSMRIRLRARLSDSDALVRAGALAALADGARIIDLDAALAEYPQSIADGDNDARLAFWTLVDSALKHEPAIPATTSRQLDGLARPADRLERIAAARVARFASWNDSTGTARPLTWYEDRARESVRAAPVLVIQTERGTMELELFSREAPLTVHNVTSLAEKGYFNGQQFHRVVPNFVAQMGDPRGDGNGGPGYAIRDEINRRRYGRGALGMALSGPHTGGSQFFVTHSPQPHLDGDYTVFGQLLAGGDVLDRIVQGDRIVSVTVR